MTPPVRLRDATPADAPQLARILIETNQQTFAGLVPDHCLTDLTPVESSTNWRRLLTSGEMEQAGQFLIVAEAAATGEVVGYALAGTATDHPTYSHELNVLMVATPWQRRGIGRRLVAAVVARLARRGSHSLLVAVQIDNPNRAFYERLSGTYVETRPLDWSGYKTEVVRYGWADTAPLMPGDAAGCDG